MKYGFVKVRAVSPSLKVGNVGYNVDKIAEEVEKAEADGIQLLVFPELSLCGYTCGDLLLSSVLQQACLNGLAKLKETSSGKEVLFFVGLPFGYNGKLHNCAAAIQNGTLLGLVPKTHLPNYNEFYEGRYFHVPHEEDMRWAEVLGETVAFGTDFIFQCRTMSDFTVACELCEDLWSPDSPSVRHALNGANIIVNLSASNEVVGKMDYRRLLVKAQSGKLCCGYVYADAGKDESTSDMIFASHNLIAENGTIISETLPFAGGYAETEIDVEMLAMERLRMNTFAGGRDVLRIYFDQSEKDCSLTRKIESMPFVPQGKELDRRCGLILSMQSSALAKRLEHTRSQTAVIGISGGLDSTLALLVTARAFDLLGKRREDIIAVTMPGFGTSYRTKNNSISLMQSMGVTIRSINIGASVNRHFKDIEHDPEDRNVTYENAQARMRTLILMDLANEHNGLVIGTGDLSELALGWCTYNGDHMSMYAVNCSVPKTLVKSLVAYEGKRVGGRLEIVLKSVLETEISPELLPPDEKGEISQKTEDLVGPYELHDFYLYQFVRKGFSPSKTLFLAEYAFQGRYDRATLKKWLVNFYRRFFMQQFKRNCVPDGVKIGSVSLSPRADWRMPSDADASLWLQEAEKL